MTLIIEGFKLRNFLYSTCFLYITLNGGHSAYAHNHHSPPKDTNWDHVESAYREFLALAPDLVESTEAPVSQPYIKSKGRYIHLNFAVWESVRVWLRVLEKEIQNHCTCEINEYELVEKAKDHIAEGFIHLKVKKPMIRTFEHIVESAYELSAIYGKSAFVIKVSMEIAETILSFSLGGKGVHVACTIIDVMLPFIFRKVQIYTHVFGNSSIIGQGRLLTMVRLFFLNRLAKRAEKKFSFLLNSTVINHESLEDVNKDDTTEGKRRRWAHILSEKLSPILVQIRDIDSRLEEESLSKQQKRKLLKQRQKLLNNAMNVTQVLKKDFLGKGELNHLRGLSFQDTVLQKKWLWPLEIQESILEKSFVNDKNSTPIFEFKSSRASGKDEIRYGISEEFVERSKNSHTNKDRHIQSVETILKDIENVFNTSLNPIERYLHAFAIDTILSVFLKHYIDIIYKRISKSFKKDLSIWEKSHLRWKLARSIYYFIIYSDFLRTISINKSESKINIYKYEAMENFLLFFEYLNSLSEISLSKNTYKEISEAIDKNLYRIQAFQIHREKRTVFSWIPFRMPVPWCQNLVRLPL